MDTIRAAAGISRAYRTSRSPWSKFTNSATRVGATTWALNTATSSIRVGLPRGPKGTLIGGNIHQTALMNVRFEGNNEHDADVRRCLLMTQSGLRSTCRIADSEAIVRTPYW